MSKHTKNGQKVCLFNFFYFKFEFALNLFQFKKKKWLSITFEHNTFEKKSARTII